MEFESRRKKSHLGANLFAFSVITAMGVGAGIIFFPDEAAGITYSYKIPNRGENVYRTVGFAAGGRWKTHFAFAPHLREALENTKQPYDAFPNDNEIADIKTRKNDDPYQRSLLLEIGPLQLRYEDLYQRIDGEGPTIFDRRSAEHQS